MEKTNIISVQSVNFREICIGNIAPNTLFRSSHPVKENVQEKVISLLAAKLKIKTVINLCDTKSEIMGKAIFAPWYNNLFKNGQVIALGMTFLNTDASYNKKLKSGLQFIIRTEGPYLIHCYAGVDRTGFFCMVLESFMGASLHDVINDYLMSFNGIFESSIYGAANKNDSEIAIHLISVMSDSQIINDKNLQAISEIYLRNKIGLSAEEIELLRMKLSAKTQGQSISNDSGGYGTIHV